MSRDILNLKLNTCHWYHQFMWERHFIRTLIDWIKIALNPFKWKDKLSIKNWDPVLLSYANDKDSDNWLGLIKETKNPEIFHISSFKDINKNEPIKLIQAGDDINYSKKIKIITDKELSKYSLTPVTGNLEYNIFYAEIIA